MGVVVSTARIAFMYETTSWPNWLGSGPFVVSEAQSAHGTFQCSQSSGSLPIDPVRGGEAEVDFGVVDDCLGD